MARVLERERESVCCVLPADVVCVATVMALAQPLVGALASFLQWLVISAQLQQTASLVSPDTLKAQREHTYAARGREAGCGCVVQVGRGT